MLASEFNDFGGSLDQHSYEACLSNISQADYFVLLVGGRVGGWFDAKSRVSITQQEYRTAYDLHCQGKLRLISFVRSEVWQLREDRKELSRFLADRAIDDRERSEIERAPSKFANDAAFIGAFISEIGRNLETGLAVATGTMKPTGNWIYQFQNYRDIHDVLQPLAFTGLTSEEAAYRKALQHELLAVMALLLAKNGDRVQDPRAPLRRGLDALPIGIELRDEGQIVVDLEVWNSYTTVFYQIAGISLEAVVTRDALTSTTFLDYDGKVGAFVQSPAYAALWRLSEEIQRLRSLATSENLDLINETSPRTLGRKTGKLELPTNRVLLLHAIAHRWINIVSLCEALIFHLEGHPFKSPSLLPISPVSGLDERLRAELVSVEDLRNTLGLGSS